MRAMVGDEYIELDQQALEMVGKSKQLRARFCARNLSGPDDRIVWTRLRDLAAAIRAAMPAAPAASGAREAQVPARSGEIARRAPRR
jgi:hypothetical protein